MVDLEKPYADRAKAEDSFRARLDEAAENFWMDMRDPEIARQAIGDYLVDSDEVLAKILVCFGRYREEFCKVQTRDLSEKMLMRQQAAYALRIAVAHLLEQAFKFKIEQAADIAAEIGQSRRRRDV